MSPFYTWPDDPFTPGPSQAVTWSPSQLPSLERENWRLAKNCPDPVLQLIEEEMHLTPSRQADLSIDIRLHLPCLPNHISSPRKPSLARDNKDLKDGCPC